MTEPPIEELPPAVVQVSNVSLVRDVEGKLSVWVEGHKIMGATQISVAASQDGSGTLVMAIPTALITFGDRVPSPSQFRVGANVVPFGSRAAPTPAA